MTRTQEWLLIALAFALTALIILHTDEARLAQFDAWPQYAEAK